MTTKSWTLVAAVLGSSVVFLDGIVLPVALPAIGREPRLFVDVLEGQNYIQYGYLLSLSALLVLAGALSDYFGRRRVFIIGLVGFGLTSLLCGLAPNLEALIACRILQGATGALLVPGSLAILTNAFSGEEQGRAFGVWAGASSATAILGPLVGGLLVQEVSWRAIFLLNLPFIAVAVWAAWTHVEESRNDEASSSFDWLGALLVALGVGGLVFGAIYGEQRQWQAPLAFASLAVGSAAAISLPFYFARARHPLVPLSMFRSRNFTVTNISTLVIYGALYMYGGFQPLFTVGTLGYTETAVGISSIPGSLFIVLLSARFGGLAGRLGPRVFMSVGPLLMAAGVVWLARVPSSSPPWQLRLSDPASYAPSTGYLFDLLPAALTFGFGLAIMVAPLTTALMRSVPGRQAGLASAINNAISRVGPQLAGALIFVLITAGFYATLAARVPGLDVNSAPFRDAVSPLNRPADGVDPAVVAAAREASTEAFHIAMLTAAGMLVIGSAVNWFGISNAQALGSAHKES
jgi:EmrB/QacA subfamily drug resistance transporter